MGNGEDGLLSPSYICYGDGEEVQCPGGCFKNSHTGTQGMCDAGGCGETWEMDKISEWRTTLCPMVTYNSFERTMAEPQVTENLLKLTEDNNKNTRNALRESAWRERRAALERCEVRFE